ncbi:YcnI family protein [Streptomyces sp. NBC_01231]|nr:YcnI family protein [Streptomyces sp. NBC_01231]
MSIHSAARVARRTALVGAAALTATLALAAPAAAHAEVEADTSQALAENVTLSFVSEAESDSAGFTELRVVLPEGIAPGDVTLDEAPKGWKLKATSDGYSLAGPALKTGVDAEHKIKVRQLPDAKEIAFKTVETYSDGEVSRWIELPSGGAESEQPAPVLKLKAAAPGAKPVSPSPSASATKSAAPSPAPSATESDVAAAGSDADAAEADAGTSTGVIIGVVLVALAVLGGGAWWLVRRRGAASQS